MKITFNPTIKNYQTYFKQSKANVLKRENNQNLNGLNCATNYNLAFCSRTPRAIYVIDYDGNYEKIDSLSKAREIYGDSLNGVLRGAHYCVQNKTFAYADSIELPDGKINSNALYKALLAFRDAQNQPIYSIDFYGNIQRFDSVKSASAVLKVETGDITRVLSQNKKCANGYTFLKAFDVELRDKKGKILKDEDDNPILDIETFKKAREEFLYTGKRYPVVSIDENGNLIRYQNIKEASTKTNNDRINIAQSLMKQSITQEKYTYARLADVVQIDEFGDVVYDENNDFAIDYDKVEKLRKMAFDK